MKVALQFFGNQSISLDPRVFVSSIHGEILNQLYSTLAHYDPQSGEYSANLAEFEVVDPQTMRFTIREDALFHDGSPVTAEDAKASIEATRANTEEGTCNCNGGIALVESVEVEDERTFVVNTSQPALATLFELMVGPEFMISPADAGGGQGSEPVGNGPFQFADMTEGQQIALEKFEDHWKAGEVQLSGLEFVNLDPGNAQTNALLAGDVDMVTEIGLAGYETLDSREDVEGISLTNNTEFLYMLTCKADGHLFASKDVRQGVMHAMDREEINEAVYGGNASMTAAMWPPGHPYYDPAIDETYQRDVAQATELFEQAGVAGQTEGIYAASSDAAYVDTALLLSQQLAETGLTLEPVPTDDIVGDFLRPSVEAPDTLEHDATIVTHTRPGLQKLTRMFEPGEIVNTCNFENERATEILERLQGLAPDDPEAIELWQEVQMMNVEEAWYPIFGFYPAFSGYSSNLGGVEPESFAPYTQGGAPYEEMFIRAS